MLTNHSKNCRMSKTVCKMNYVHVRVSSHHLPDLKAGVGFSKVYKKKHFELYWLWKQIWLVCTKGFYLADIQVSMVNTYMYIIMEWGVVCWTSIGIPYRGEDWQLLLSLWIIIMWKSPEIGGPALRPLDPSIDFTFLLCAFERFDVWKTMESLKQKMEQLYYWRRTVR